jgi:dienelactone hydrolase
MKQLLATILLFFTCNIVYANDAEKSWKKAVVFTPYTVNAASISDIKTDQRYPVIVYLHGCTGIVDWHDYDWGRTLAKSGYIVIIPDSMARMGRVPNCDPVRKSGSNLFPMAYEYRQQEIEYALEQLKNSTWADNKKLFLMGHSEGGISVARSQYAGFRAHIILAWTCTSSYEMGLDGIRSPKEVPILAVAAIRDQWRVGKKTYGRCIDKADGRNVTQVDLDGEIHATTKYPESKPAVLNFLKQF